MLTRSQVARRIGRSLATVRRMEGVSLHPDHGPRGMRIFDPDEVDHVADQIARTGRALQVDQADFCIARRHPSTTRPPKEESQELRNATSEVVRLQRQLRQLRLEQAEWSARVDDAIEDVLASVGSSDEDILDALEVLVQAARPT